MAQPRQNISLCIRSTILPRFLIIGLAYLESNADDFQFITTCEVFSTMALIVRRDSRNCCY